MARRPCPSGSALILVALLAAAGLAACESEKITHYPMPEVVDDTDADASGSTDDEEDVVTGAGLAGATCASGADCTSGFCFDEAGAAALSDDLEVDAMHLAAPGGMCVARGCDDTSCGDGATCTDMSPYGLLESWCLADCVELYGCRWQEGYTCHGLLDEDAEAGVCLPDVIVGGAAAASVGGPCEVDTDCPTEFCFNDPFLDDLGTQFGLDTSPFDIPAGMCSAICFDDEACGPGGLCVNLQDTFGAPFNLCMKQCQALSDCRWDEGYQCFLADEASALTVCLPDNLIIAAECDDGHCEGGG